MSRLATLFLAAALVQAAPAASGPGLTWQGRQFLLDGRPWQIRSGEMHYPRVPRAAWRRNMRQMRALGLNTLCTYVFWNLHEPEPGRFDFSGDLDLAAYLRTAQEEGLKVLLRPGPYICSEWDFGGLPAWLLREPDLQVRSADPRFLAATAAYLKRVAQEVEGLQADRGGPILMVQVENEYGSFGKDPVYKAAIRQAMTDAGFRVPFYTSDGPGQELLAAGSFPDLLATINFGAEADLHEPFAERERFGAGEPQMCGEYWAGWFDHYGKPHHRTDPRAGAAGLAWMLQRGISFNLYMFHGGTNFGFMNGANWTGRYAPDTTSYDYDALLDEAGRPTPKYQAYRAAIQAALPNGERLPEPPAVPATITIPTFRFTESAPLDDLLRQGVRTQQPQTMEALGQSHGYLLYRHIPAKAARGILEINDLKDYAVVVQDRRVLGSLDRRLRQSCLDLDLQAGKPLDLLVENGGRINFAKEFVAERKGIAGPVSFADEPLRNWECFPLPMTDLGALRFGPAPVPAPAFHRASFQLNVVGDTFLDTRGWGKGFLVVNGHLLGRHWRIGPQEALFCPASFLRVGANEIIVFELEDHKNRTMAGLPDPPLNP